MAESIYPKLPQKQELDGYIDPDEDLPGPIAEVRLILAGIVKSYNTKRIERTGDDITARMKSALPESGFVEISVVADEATPHFILSVAYEVISGTGNSDTLAHMRYTTVIRCHVDNHHWGISQQVVDLDVEAVVRTLRSEVVIPEADYEKDQRLRSACVALFRYIENGGQLTMPKPRRSAPEVVIPQGIPTISVREGTVLYIRELKRLEQLMHDLVHRFNTGRLHRVDTWPLNISDPMPQKGAFVIMVQIDPSDQTRSVLIDTPIEGGCMHTEFRSDPSGATLWWFEQEIPRGDSTIKLVSRIPLGDKHKKINESWLTLTEELSELHLKVSLGAAQVMGITFS